MSFFNKKYDVLDIELTPYGRHLLQNGKLMPAYYAFFDDDVLYDSAAGGFTEKNSDVKNRIINQTPVLRSHYAFKDLEKQQSAGSQYQDIKSSNADETAKFLQYSLGTSDPTKEKAPAWEIFTLKNEISSSTNQLTSSNYQPLNIAQLEFDINYEISVENINDKPSGPGLTTSPDQQVSQIMPDGTFVNVQDDQILLHILEKNGFLYGDSLEVEVFMFETTSSATGPKTFTEELIPLTFIEREQQIVNGILMTEEQDMFNVLEDSSKVTPSNVEYYFDCRLDKEIPIKDLCDGIQKLKSSGAPVDFDIECPDVGADVSGFSIYDSKITDAPEDCD